MRRFLCATVDTITNLGMVYSECSYNMACMQIETEIRNADLTIKDINVDSITIKNIPLMRICFDIDKANSLVYYYDEGRGYLMKGVA